jgi:hypothetical protein
MVAWPGFEPAQVVLASAEPAQTRLGKLGRVDDSGPIDLRISIGHRFQQLAGTLFVCESFHDSASFGQQRGNLELVRPERADHHVIGFNSTVDAGQDVPLKGTCRRECTFLLTDLGNSLISQQM